MFEYEAVFLRPFALSMTFPGFSEKTLSLTDEAAVDPLPALLE